MKKRLQKVCAINLYIFFPPLSVHPFSTLLVLIRFIFHHPISQTLEYNESCDERRTIFQGFVTSLGERQLVEICSSGSHRGSLMKKCIHVTKIMMSFYQSMFTGSENYICRHSLLSCLFSIHIKRHVTFNKKGEMFWICKCRNSSNRNVFMYSSFNCRTRLYNSTVLTNSRDQCCRKSSGIIYLLIFNLVKRLCFCRETYQVFVLRAQ